MYNDNIKRARNEIESASNQIFKKKIIIIIYRYITRNHINTLDSVIISERIAIPIRSMGGKNGENYRSPERFIFHVRLAPDKSDRLINPIRARYLNKNG